MKLLNVVCGTSLRCIEAEPDVMTMDIRGRIYTYDVNSMAVHLQASNEVGSVRGLPMVPQFPLHHHMCPQKVALSITHACPLACKYCYQRYLYPDGSSNMGLDTAKMAVQSILNREVFSKNKSMKPGVGFFGGEPLVNWKLVEDVVNFCNGYYPTKVGYSITTNAVLMTEEIARFMAKHGFSSIVSIDGSKLIHDRYRMGADGNGTFSKVMKALMMMRDAGVRPPTLRATFTADCTKIKERVSFLNMLCDEGLGGWVSVEPVNLCETGCVGTDAESMKFDTDDIESLESEYLDCAEYFAEGINKGKLVRFHNLFVPFQRLAYTQHAPSECGAGTGYQAVNPDGDVFACHREQSSRIGTLSQGIDEKERAKWIDNRGIYTRPKCGECPIRFVCGGGCRESSIGANGDILEPNINNCAFQMLWFKAAVYALGLCDKDKLVKVVHPKGSRRPEKVSRRPGKGSTGTPGRPGTKITPREGNEDA